MEDVLSPVFQHAENEMRAPPSAHFRPRHVSREWPCTASIIHGINLSLSGFVDAELVRARRGPERTDRHFAGYLVCSGWTGLEYSRMNTAMTWDADMRGR
jgi:hypothetical protein